MIQRRKFYHSIITVSKNWKTTDTGSDILDKKDIVDNFVRLNVSDIDNNSTRYERFKKNRSKKGWNQALVAGVPLLLFIFGKEMEY